MACVYFIISLISAPKMSVFYGIIIAFCIFLCPSHCPVVIHIWADFRAWGVKGSVNKYTLMPLSFPILLSIYWFWTIFVSSSGMVRDFFRNHLKVTPFPMKNNIILANCMKKNCMFLLFLGNQEQAQTSSHRLLICRSNFILVIFFFSNVLWKKVLNLFCNGWTLTFSALV